MFRGTLLLLGLIASHTAPTVAVESYAQSFGGQKQEVVRRERNLDHWDADTLAYFLDNHIGYDVAVMFYAQWDTNSHALAPLWDRIATIVEAGSSNSKLVMALFDCERDYQHSQLCAALSITHYPTLMFVGSGTYYDTDPITSAIFGKSKSAGPMGHAPVSNTVKFQGNWQYGDAILDWVRTMQALSKWHTWSTEGFGSRMRNFFIRAKRQNPALPVGIPASGIGRASATSAAMGAASTGASTDAAPSTGESAEMKMMESQFDALKASSDTLRKSIVRASVMLDMMLESKNSTDVFAVLHKIDGWVANVPDEIEVLRTCVLEVSLDYCERVSTHVANEIVDELDLEDGSAVEEMDLEQLENDILQRINSREPYCKVLEVCLTNGMQPADECIPATCPFQNQVAVRYLESCLDPTIQSEYSEALGLTSASAATDAASASADAASSGWGI